MLSTGSPITFSTRPSVAGPTGTSTGWPRLMAFMPRTRPSVGCSATVRTRPSPMCCCASQMMSMGVGTSKPSLTMLIAVCTSGICPSGNSQSTAGPATWTTLPVTTPLLVAIISLLRRGRAAHHFDDLFGDARLAHAVHVQSQPLDHVGRVGSGRVHRGHACRMFGGGGFQHRPVELHFDISRQQILHHLGGRLLIDIIHRARLFRHVHLQHPRKRHRLSRYALEFVVKQVDRVDLLVAKEIHRLLRDGGDLVVIHFRSESDVIAGNRHLALAEKVPTLAPDQLEADLRV